MKGSRAILESLLIGGVKVCFSNPGTSEMNFVASLDDVPEMRGILTLFEGVASGAADGYARIANHPAAVLLHLGPGLSNAGANLHNARRANSPIVTIVGDHASFHLHHDPPLASDIDSLASPISKAVLRAKDLYSLPEVTSDAVRASIQRPRGPVALIVPADFTWLDADFNFESIDLFDKQEANPIDVDFDPAVAALKAEGRVAFLIGREAMSQQGVTSVERVAQRYGALVLSETFSSVIDRGRGVPNPDKLSYFGEGALAQLAGVSTLILIGASRPVAFFAYPDKPSSLVPEGCSVIDLTPCGEDAAAVAACLAEQLGVSDFEIALSEHPLAPIVDGPLTASSVATVLSHLLPEGAIVSEESVTAALSSYLQTRGSAPHRWMNLMGGAIGQGMPLATGAAVASPTSKVINIQADGSSLYTIQSLWTQARENLDVVTILLNNRAYAILQLEFGRVGAERAGDQSQSMLNLFPPELDFVRISEGFGVPATRATTVREFTVQLEEALAARGPRLIEAYLPVGLS